MSKLIKIKNLVSGVATDQELSDGLALKYDASNPLGFETPTQLTARDTLNRNRANHTGTQLASTISDFVASVRGTALSGLSLATSTVISATDNILEAIGKLQAQITKILVSETPNSTGATNSAGTSTSVARADHVHNTVIPVYMAYGNSEVQVSASGTPILLSGMTITPPAGTYFVEAYANAKHNDKGGITHYAIYAGESVVVSSQNSVTNVDATGVIVSTKQDATYFGAGEVTVNGSQAIELRWRSQSGTGKTYSRLLKCTRIR